MRGGLPWAKHLTVRQVLPDHVVDTPQGQVLCNRCQLHVVSENTTSEQNNSKQETLLVLESSTQQTSELHRPVTRSMTRTVIRPPDRVRH